MTDTEPDTRPSWRSSIHLRDAIDAPIGRMLLASTLLFAVSSVTYLLGSINFDSDVVAYEISFVLAALYFCFSGVAVLLLAGVSGRELVRSSAAAFPTLLVAGAVIALVSVVPPFELSRLESGIFSVVSLLGIYLPIRWAFAPFVAGMSTAKLQRALNTAAEVISGHQLAAFVALLTAYLVLAIPIILITLIVNGNTTITVGSSAALVVVAFGSLKDVLFLTWVANRWSRIAATESQPVD